MPRQRRAWLPGTGAHISFFRSAHTRFAQRFHRRSEGQTLGPVFADRPSLHAVKPELLPRLVVYHHRNPVEAGVVERPRQSRWTSHRAYLRLEPAPSWLDVEWALDRLGFTDTAGGRRHFDEYVMEFDLDAGFPKVGCPSSGKPQLTAPGSSLSNLDWQRLVTLARDVTGLSSSESLSSKRRRAAMTRRLICIVAIRDLGLTYEAVAARLAMRTGSVFNLVQRPGPAGQLDALLEALRETLAAA